LQLSRSWGIRARACLFILLFRLDIFSVQNSEHPDNWSIPMVELTWLGAAAMVLLSQNWFRRRRYFTFYLVAQKKKKKKRKDFCFKCQSIPVQGFVLK
jgi:hypothetical protein